MADPFIIFPSSSLSPQEGHWQRYNQRRFVFFISALDHHHQVQTGISRRAAQLSARTRIHLGGPSVSFRLFSYAKPCDINGRLLVFSWDPLYIGSLSPVLASQLAKPVVFN